MAVAVVGAGVQSAEDIINAAVARSKAVMQRQWAVYDVEKVFWNSVWTLGLIGLGYIAVKLGEVIVTVETTVEIVTSVTKAGQADLETYKKMFPYCDPSGDKYKDANGNWIPWPDRYFGAIVDYFRNNPDEWDIYKSKIAAKYPEGVKEVAGKGGLTVVDVLTKLDQFYSEYGPIMPFVAVAGHMGLESLRVHRLRKRLKREL